MKEKQKRKLETGTLLFPFLISGAADKLSSYIDECVGEVPSLKESEPNCVSAKSLRMGSLQECAIRNVRDAGDYRGHWAETHTTHPKNSDFYMEGCHDLLRISGMALAGFDETRYTIKPPSCEIFLQTMAAEERQKFQNFLSHIMAGPFDISSNHSHLQPLGYHMFAAFMRWYPVFIGDFGHNHCALDKLKSAMLIFEYNWDMFDVWSDLVQKDFLAKNARIFATEDTFRDGKESLYGPQILEGVLQIKTTQIIESKKCEDQRKRLDKIERIVSDIHQLGR
jgi:hypothetical protein